MILRPALVATQAPLWRTRLDPSNRITNQTSFLWLAAQGAIDLAGEGKTVSTYSVPRTIRQRGVAGSFNGTTGQAFFAGPTIPGAGAYGGYTLVALVEFPAVDTTAATICSLKFVSGLGDISLSIWTNALSTTNISAGGYNGSGTFTILQSNATISARTPYVVVATFAANGTIQSLRVNEVTGTTTPSFTFSEPQVAGMSVGCRQTTAGTYNSRFTGSIHLVAAIPGQLPAADAISLVRDPFQFFEPRRHWLPITAVGGNITLPTGLAAETDAAFALVGTLRGAVGLATETDSALALAGALRGAVGLAQEADAALALLGSLRGAVGVALEADLALALAMGSGATPVGLAEETDTAFALQGAIRGSMGLAVEADTALGLQGAQRATVGLAQSTEAALALAGRLQRVIGLALETDTAFALSMPGVGGGATPAEVWGYLLSNGLTAEQTLVAIHKYLLDLHRIHGLEVGAPLVVTPTSRSTLGINQLITAVGEVVTVTRQ